VVLTALVHVVIACTVTAPMLESLADFVPSLYGSAEGTAAIMYCLGYGTAKDRKAILKAMKGNGLRYALPYLVYPWSMIRISPNIRYSEYVYVEYIHQTCLRPFFQAVFLGCSLLHLVDISLW